MSRKCSEKKGVSDLILDESGNIIGYQSKRKSLKEIENEIAEYSGETGILGGEYQAIKNAWRRGASSEEIINAALEGPRKRARNRGRFARNDDEN